MSTRAQPMCAVFAFFAFFAFFALCVSLRLLLQCCPRMTPPMLNAVFRNERVRALMRTRFVNPAQHYGSIFPSL